MKQHYKHILAWGLYALSLYFFFEYLTDTETAIIHVASFVGNQILVFYLNFNYLLPKFYQKNRYFSYGFLNIVLVILGSIINSFAEQHTPEASLEPKSILIIKNSNIFDLEPLLAHSMPSVLAVFIALFMYSYYKRKQQEEKELAIIIAEKNFLIQQINPHFLFNVLNNIYSLTLENNPRGAEAVLQLSRMLDYSLCGNKEKTVLLKDEIQYIINFIELFKLKDDDIKNIVFNHDNVIPNTKIAPMLLLPFVENAFKHGNIEDITNGKIDIGLMSTQKYIQFICKNTYDIQKKIDKSSGIGVTNVTRRLELLYPEKHYLKITKNKDTFEVILKIEINEI